MIEQEQNNTRIVIEKVEPEIDSGRFPVKRIVGDNVTVEADIFCDGHDIILAFLRYRKEREPDWTESPMEALGNDRWRGSFVVDAPGRYFYNFVAWADKFQTWRWDLTKHLEAEQDVSVEFLEGAELIMEASQRATNRDAETMRGWANRLLSTKVPAASKAEMVLSPRVITTMNQYPDRRRNTEFGLELSVIVDREKARFSTWYEMFPRSCAPEPDQHGTFKDCETRLAYISKMGFDVLYFPPIHPIGQTNRKGKNNATASQPEDPGTPWAIGAAEGGHKAIHPQLGSLEDFRMLIARARGYGIEIALDLAFQCSPDHPYVTEHPEWFRRRPDGTIRYAENPPKKYQDIYPLEFETEHWRELWEELKSIVFFWIEQGVYIFRVDNPHTKPFVFWEWLIGEVKRDYPEVLFLSEAFTRPKVMYQLTKRGFSQSYTYFTWRNVKWDITQYFTELTQTAVKEDFRPNLWPNTPDILHDYLRDGGRPAFKVRLVLAATLGANYGIYGPAFELCENVRRDMESEEYLNSEKYEIKHWNLESPDSLKNFIARVNQSRKDNPALQSDLSLRFHTVDNDQLICYSKCTQDLSNIILVVVNLDYRHRQLGWIDLPLLELGLNPIQPFQVYDLLNEVSYQWHGSRNYVELDPKKTPAHIFRVSGRRTPDMRA